MTPKPLPTHKPPAEWNARELEVLRQEYSLIGTACQSLLPDRSPAAIHAQAKAQGLPPPRRWSAEELSILQREYPLRGEACRAMLPGRGALAINVQAHRMGLRPPTPAFRLALSGKTPRGRA
ncbi:hypothetical protein JW897_22585 [Chromobacterium alkanivorans]|uniref:hypothetical protein n=1 Tax=Chromobacterium TaxID=535 RepID=UPI0006535F06|nr:MULTISPECIES: hypothetical protein [Chromobacterium]KMN83841.1 hypothetical protein VK98_01405 [Chromobacterium sp. LK11]MBN3006534.1 hypothetical protein [Chromobacterium alkanivorans]